MTEIRKITAILAADVVGYSRLTGADEDRTLARLRALRSDVIDPTISVHHGRVVKRTGDGAIIEFRSIVDAVRCALEVQTTMIERNAGVAEDKRIVFRIGIHVGDVVEETDGDLMGDGVNVAARLESIAKPGAIYLSEDAYRQVKSRLDLKVSDLGPTQLKNIAEPMRVYSLEVGTFDQTKSAPAGPPADQSKSLFTRSNLGWAPISAIAGVVLIAAASGWYILGGRPTKPAQAAAHLSLVVLPFANLSGDPAQDYFADGITDNLTTDLSRISGSVIIARNTAFTYKGKNVDAKEIGKDLGVRYVLEGSVQRDQGRVRVNAQLIDAETGVHLWADRFEEDVADLFKLQDEVVARLARSLDVALSKAEAEKAGRSKNPDVVDLTMRGFDWHLRGIQQSPTEHRESNHQARALFDRALEIDPNDATALAGSADTYIYDRLYGWGDPATDYENKVLGQANHAIDLARDNVLGYYEKAWYLSLSRRFSEALGVTDVGLAVNPNFVPLYIPRAIAENSLGRFEQAKADAERAIRLSPRDPDIGAFHVDLGEAELGLGHFDAAIEECHKAIDSGYRPFFAYTTLAAAYAYSGKMDEAREALTEARRLNPKLTVKWMTANTPNIPAVFEGVRKAGLPEE
jgi:adenylate cyclase